MNRQLTEYEFDVVRRILARSERPLREALAAWGWSDSAPSVLGIAFGSVVDGAVPPDVEVAGIGTDVSYVVQLVIGADAARLVMHNSGTRGDAAAPPASDTAGIALFRAPVAEIDGWVAEVPASDARRLLARVLGLAIDESLDAGRAVLNHTARFLAGRQTTEGVLLDIPEVRGKFADLHAWLDVLSTARMEFGDDAEGERDIVASSRVALSKLRVLATDCVQLCGGWGYIARNPVAAFYRTYNALYPVLSAWCRLLQANAPARDDARPLLREHAAMRMAFDDFLLTEVVNDFPSWEVARAVPREVFQAFGARGYLRQAAPVGLGGTADGFARNMHLTELMMGRDLFGLTVSTMLVANTAIPALGRYASPELQQRYLPAILEGEIVPCLAVTEAGSAGSMVQTLQTTATDDGDAWVLNGSKRYITNAPIADLGLVLARTGSTSTAQAFSLLCVPMHQPGVQVAEKYEKLGAHCSETGHIEFTNVRVPKDHVVGHVGSGLMYVVDVIVEERVLIGAAAIAYATYVLERSAGQITGRRQLAVLDAWRDEASLLRGKCWATAARTVARRPISTDAAMLKYICADFAKQCIEVCSDVLEEEGLMHANVGWLSRARLEARVLSLFTGASGVMRDYYSRRISAGVKLQSA